MRTAVHLVLAIAASVPLLGGLACGGAKKKPPATASDLDAPRSSPPPAAETKRCSGSLARACVDLAATMMADPARAKEGLDLLEQACDDGNDARGCGLLATALAEASKGKPPTDPQRLTTAAERACRARDERGCAIAVALADAFVDGRFGEPDLPRAITLFRTACSAGSAHSCVAMGRASADGGVEGMHDPERAVTYFKMACDGDAAEGCAGLAIATASGRGTAKDETAARTLATRACDRGSSDGCAALGVLLEKEDAKAAVAAFDRACTIEAGPERAPACARVALAHATGRGAAVDLKKSGAFFERACSVAAKAGSDEEVQAGCILLAVMFESSFGYLVAKNDAMSIALYDYVCDRRKSPNGCAARGSYLERTGQRARARADFQRACKAGVNEACERLK